VTAAGKASALVDRCCHRTAKLSKGWLDAGNIVCPYHGWTYAATAGACASRSGRTAIPEEYRGRGVRCVERYGVVWVALEEPLAPIPDWPEESDPGYRRIDQFYEQWSCAPFRLMENSFDNAHIHFVHRNTSATSTIPTRRRPRSNAASTASSPAPTCRC
jgi:phenylpropionate dioxygenase-like ring-hydroxylating dioxygenase large terminal subunit